MIYLPVDGVDWDLIRSTAEVVFVGNEVDEAGMRGGRLAGDFDEPDEDAWLRSTGGSVVAGGTKGWVVCSDLATGRVKTVCEWGSGNTMLYVQLEKGIDGLGAIVVVAVCCMLCAVRCPLLYSTLQYG